ncbi:MAG: tRNA 2-thiouridine(34) synthase MnmA [bacterium]|nr:tRNA 2-thiouridine(34) synthase MnmA [bacterium]
MRKKVYLEQNRRVYPERSRKVFVGMSGGVDSSVAAWLLKKQGYDVTGVFMRCFNLDGCAEKDAEDARRVASCLKIPFYVFDFEEEYKKTVVDYMVNGYKRGLTPNPDVMCNKEIKFGLFLKKALALGADYVATGHYAIVKKENNFFKISAGKDKNKDQSYFLWTLNQDQLKHCLFPIGGYQKLQVRVMAKKAGLPTAVKKDSQGICFLGNISMVDFLKTRLAVKIGKIVDVEGRSVGEHEGIHFYTIGQRHLGIKNNESRFRGNRETKPLYVATKNIRKNILIVAEDEENSALYRKEVELETVNFIDPALPSLIRANGGIRVLARVRYRQPLTRGFLSRSISTRSGFRLVFDNPQKFVAAGQSAVFYSPIGSLEMLGGGVII